MSANPCVHLLQVPPPYAEALRVLAATRKLPVVDGSCRDARCTGLVLVGGTGSAPLDAFEAARKCHPEAPVVSLLSARDVETAVALMRAGAVDVIPLPALPVGVARRALMAASPPAEAEELRGGSAAMRRVRAELRQVAGTECAVLLTGETGTGKGLAARLLHEASRRAAGAFVHADCASLAPTVIESELFGHERGAFTGAQSRRVGRIERARAGTLFLDEIGELAPELQAKLLRVLQDRRFERVGGEETVVADARIIAATNRNLRAEVETGDFRADLYFRLKVFAVELPALRERLADLPALVEHGLSSLAGRHRLPVPRIGPDFLGAVAAYRWPGNVRELHNVLERLVVTSSGRELRPDALEGLLEDGWALQACPASLLSPRQELEETLRATGGNVSRAARRLGISRGTLRHRIDRYGLAATIPRD